MKATGIVRRIDDLGRIVIPKEIRRTMHIREGDPLEIYTDRDGEVIFKKYSPIGEIGNFAIGYCEVLAKATNGGILITDRDTVIATSGVNKKDFLEKRLSRELEAIMEGRNTYEKPPNEEGISILDGGDRYLATIVSPILANGDVIGSVVLMILDENLGLQDSDKKLMQISAGFLGRHMES